jgi:hypothetical protein
MKSGINWLQGCQGRKVVEQKRGKEPNIILDLSKVAEMGKF